MAQKGVHRLLEDGIERGIRKGIAHVRNQFDRYKLTATERILLQEEYKAEKRLGYIRLGLYTFFFLEILGEHLFLSIPLHKSFIPYTVAILVSAAIAIELRFWGQERFARYYNHYIKYGYITTDIILANLIVYNTATGLDFMQLFNLPQFVAPSLALVLYGVMFISLSILRLSWRACVYTGVAFWLSWFVQGLLQNFFPWPEGFLSLGTLSGVNLIGHFYLGIMAALTAIAAYSARRFKQVVLRSRRQEELERFLPAFVAEGIVSGQQELSTGGTLQKVTILFSDIRDFTSLSEEETPEEVITLLNTYLNDMIEIVFHYGGTLDKIMGDGIMALYGAPIFDDDAPANAIMSAVDMQRKLVDFNSLRELQGKKPIKIGIGIHTGEVILGNVGSSKRIEFTAIGDAVNTASRIEGLTKKTDSPILISGETLSHLNGSKARIEAQQVLFKNIGKVELRGKQKQMELFAVESSLTG